MDPDAAVDLINDAASRRDWGDVDRGLYDLAEWVDRGGFFPSRKIELGRDGMRQLGLYYQNHTDATNASRIIAGINKRLAPQANPCGGVEPAPKAKPKRKGRKSKKKDDLTEQERKRLLRKISRI